MNSMVMAYGVLAALSFLTFLVMLAQWWPVAAKVNWPQYFAVTFQLVVVGTALLFYLSLLLAIDPVVFSLVADLQIAAVAWRYIYWALTTPFLITAFFFLLWQYYPTGNVLALVLRVGVLMLLVLGFGYVSETQFIAEGTSLITWVTFVISMVLLFIYVPRCRILYSTGYP